MQLRHSGAGAIAWHRSAQHGRCRGASPLIDGNCLLDDTVMSGSWKLTPSQSADWSTAYRACSHKCSVCPRCHFMSISLVARNCSWFANCDLPSKLVPGQGFLTGRFEPLYRSIDSEPTPKQSRTPKLYASPESFQLPACAASLLRKCTLRDWSPQRTHAPRGSDSAFLPVGRIYVLHHVCAMRRLAFQEEQVF